MTLPSLYMTIVAALFAVYGLACSVECAIALRMARGDVKAKSLFSPLWEVTNVFLVFGFTGLAVIFNNALSNLSHAVLSVLSVAFVSLLLRACLGLVIFYGGNTSRPGLVRLFALANLATPLSFAAAGVYLLTGQQFYQSLVGVALELSALFGLIAVGLSITDRFIGEDMAISELLYLVWLICLGTFIPLSVQHSGSLLQTLPIAVLTLLSFIGMCMVLAKYSFGLKRTWLYIPLLAIAAPIVLAWANQPYLVSGGMKLSDAYGAEAFSSIFLVGLAVVLPLILIGAGLYIWLLMPSRSKK